MPPAARAGGKAHPLRGNCARARNSRLRSVAPGRAAARARRGVAERDDPRRRLPCRARLRRRAAPAALLPRGGRVRRPAAGVQPAERGAARDRRRGPHAGGADDVRLRGARAVLRRAHCQLRARAGAADASAASARPVWSGHVLEAAAALGAVVPRRAGDGDAARFVQRH